MNTITDLTWRDFRALLDKLPVGIVAFDDRQRVIGLNRAAEAILDVDRQGAAGLKCHELFTEQSPSETSAAARPADPVQPEVEQQSRHSRAGGNPASRPNAPSADPREVLQTDLEATGWNVAKTARRLQLSRTTIYQRIARYGLRRPPES